MGRAQFSVGSVEGVPFTSCTSGPDIIILAGNFARVQQITLGSPISSLDCSTDVGKIAAAYDNKMVIFEPIPLVQQQTSVQTSQSMSVAATSSAAAATTTAEGVTLNATRLDYKWVQTATIESDTPILVMSFNLEGNKLIAGGETLQLWVIDGATKTNWQCIWRCKTPNTVTYLKYSPDGTFFSSASKCDRLVKIWYENVATTPSSPISTTANNINEPSATTFSFIYVAHPKPISGLEWRRTSKYTPKGAVANVLITSCTDNIARIWVQTLLSHTLCTTVHFHLSSIIEASVEVENSESQFVVHWINNKEIQIARSIELLLHDMLTRILRGNNPPSSSTNSPQSAGESCSGSENLEDPNEDTITAKSSKKLRHKLCRKMNKQRALAASGKRDLGDSDDNSQNHTNRTTGQLSNNSHSSNGRTSPTSLVEEFDKALESLLKKWQMSTDLLFSINKYDGTLTLWQVKYLDGEDTGIFRQVQIEKLSRLKSALPHYDSTTMSLNVTAYSPSAYLDVKKAYLAVTGSSNIGSNNTNGTNDENLSPVDVPEILSINTDSTSNTNQTLKGSLYEMRESASNGSITDAEPTIFMVTQHLSGILGLWKLNFDSNYPKVQAIDLVTRITGLPIDPTWLQDGTLFLKYIDKRSALSTKWVDDQIGLSPTLKGLRQLNSPCYQTKNNTFNFEEAQVKSSLHSNLASVDEEIASKPNERIQEDFDEFYKASHMASSMKILPQYHLKQLIELLTFGKLQRVKAILNHLVNCLVVSENHDRDLEASGSSQWAHRSRTLSIVAQSAPSFHDSFDIDNPSSTIQQQVIEEIELDYIEVTSIKPLPLYSLLAADNEKPNACDNRSNSHEEFSASYESIMKSRSQVDETLDEILGQSTLETLNKQKELKRLASDPLGKGSLTSFNPKKAKLLTRVLTHTHLPGLSNLDQMHLLAVADAVALFDASPEDLNDLNDNDTSHGGISTNIAIDSLDDRGLRFLTAMRQHVYLTRCLPMKQRNELKASGIGTHNIIWAFHSESQDELISLIPCVQRNKPEWAELREFGIGWWVKKLEVLKKLIEKVAQSAYQARQDPLDAALFYLAMKKKTLVCALLRRVNCDKRLQKLFEQDFNDPVNRKKALKNAYALLGLHRFEHAAAFFILAGSIWDAVEVCINNLNDVQLAMVLIRLHDNDSSLPCNLRRLLFTEILGSKRPIDPVSSSTTPSHTSSTRNSVVDRKSSVAGVQYNYDPKRAHQDPFLRSMAFWKLGDYLSAVHTLLETDVGIQRPRPSISQQHSMNHGSRRNSEVMNRFAGSSGSASPIIGTGLTLPDGSTMTSASNVSISASVFNFYLFLKDQPMVTKHRNQLMEEVEIRKRKSPVEEEQVHCHRARSLSSGEISFDERGVKRTVKQSSTEYEVLNETTRLVDKYSDEAIADKERVLFFSTANVYLEAGCPLLALEVLGSEDHLNMSKAQRMKFVACLNILMNELNTLANSSQETPGDITDFNEQFHEWLKMSFRAIEKMCNFRLADYSEVESDSRSPEGFSTKSSREEEELKGQDSCEDSGELITRRYEVAEPILRTLLTYCSLHSQDNSTLLVVRRALLECLKKV